MAQDVMILLAAALSMTRPREDTVAFTGLMLIVLYTTVFVLRHYPKRGLKPPGKL